MYGEERKDRNYLPDIALAISVVSLIVNIIIFILRQG